MIWYDMGKIRYDTMRRVCVWVYARTYVQKNANRVRSVLMTKVRLRSLKGAEGEEAQMKKRHIRDY